MKGRRHRDRFQDGYPRGGFRPLGANAFHALWHLHHTAAASNSPSRSKKYPASLSRHDASSFSRGLYFTFWSDFWWREAKGSGVRLQELLLASATRQWRMGRPITSRTRASDTRTLRRNAACCTLGSQAVTSVKDIRVSVRKLNYEMFVLDDRV